MKPEIKSIFLDKYFDKVFLLGFEILSNGPAGDYCGRVMGRFESIIAIGEEEIGFFKQVQSREIPMDRNYLLYR